MTWNILYGAPASQAAIVQSAVKDSNPNNVDSYDNGSGDPHHNASQSVEFGANTTAGNALLILPVIAWDGQYVITNVSDPVNGNWTSVGDLLNTDGTNCDFHPYVKFNAQPLLRTSWSGTGAVSSGGVLTIGSGSGPFRLNQRILSASTPVPGNTQNVSSPASFDNIVTVVSLLSGTLGAAGSTYQLNPNIGSVTFSSQAMTTRDFVSVTRFTPVFPQVVGDYPGAIVFELSHTDGSSVYFSGHNDLPSGAGTDNLTSGNVVAAAAPGLVIAMSFNGGAPTPTYAPTKGTGWTLYQTILQYNLGLPICTIETQHFASIGTRAATFSSGSGSSSVATLAVALLDGP